MIDLTSYKIGETDQLIEVDDREDLSDFILTLAQQAQHRILIFSHDLDKALFDTDALYEAIKNLAIKSRRTHIHILVHDPKPMVKDGHRLLQLARRISSHMAIKITAKEHHDVYENFILFDDDAYIIRDNPTRFTGKGTFNAPLKTRQLSDQFLEMWERGRVDSSLRRLSL